MPAFNPLYKRATKITSGSLTDPWDAEIDGYDIFKLEDIIVERFNVLLLNISIGNHAIVNSTMGDVSLGITNGTRKLTDPREDLRFIAGSLDWNLSPYSTELLESNFCWAKSDVNIDDMTPKFTGIVAQYPEYRNATINNKTAVLPYISNTIDIVFRQQPQSIPITFLYTLYGMNNVT